MKKFLFIVTILAANVIVAALVINSGVNWDSETGSLVVRLGVTDAGSDIGTGIGVIGDVGGKVIGGAGELAGDAINGADKLINGDAPAKTN